MGAFKRGAVVGFAAGYVLGSKAGRERYEQIRRNWQKVQSTAGYQKLTGKAEAALGLGIERGKLMMLDGVEKATGAAKDKVRGRTRASHLRSTFN